MSKKKFPSKLRRYKIFNNVYAYFGSHHADHRGHSMDWNEHCRLFVHRRSDFAVDPKTGFFTHIFFHSSTIRKVLNFRVDKFFFKTETHKSGGK
jgi:hypothetical protein